MNDQFEQVWRLAINQFHGPEHSLHGPGHWRRVERNGILLSSRTGADLKVVQLFAIFHDSQRINDGWDEGHGARGAEYAASLRGTAYNLSDSRFELLQYACVWHTEGKHHLDPTIGTCWDADRLDIGRVGVAPNAKFMSTAFGREIAAAGSIWQFIQSTDET